MNKRIYIIIILSLCMFLLCIYLYFWSKKKRQFLIIKGNYDYLIHAPYFIPEQICNMVSKYYIKKHKSSIIQKNDIISRNIYTLSENNSFEKEIISMFTKGPYYERIKKLCSQVFGHNDINLMKNTGVDIRKYSKGSFMKEHRDVVLTNPPQYEIILILKNDSDSYFYYKNDNNVKTKLNTNKGDLIIVRAGGISHGVSKCSFGERIILKFAYGIIK